ncbi:hypothetical protein [uncultured Spirosoma sp.]|uniref:Uncharacterized protein n=1 Tax=Spirosoma linguale (strain ATCC 33905 / DSM 74 / LMG 10896 / Claus 1) TaxID=504472 RepID=D2QW16_SPILD|nr:hypothetical protein [uncultured Spirosoma sp.]ADB42998.1 hypothetical protein Slin_7055 [Spirosoma linguale DSM 74]
MKAIVKLIGLPGLIVALLSACGPTESTETTTKSTRLDSLATILVDSASTLGADSVISPRSTP